jgi:hypothetical protein
LQAVVFISIVADGQNRHPLRSLSFRSKNSFMMHKINGGIDFSGAAKNAASQTRREE